MAQFVLVASGVSTVDFEKAMEVKIKSHEKVRFVPQGVPGNQGNPSSPSMSSAKAGNAEVLNNIRFEWDHEGHTFGAEIVSVLAGHHRHESLEMPAAPAA